MIVVATRFSPDDDAQPVAVLGVRRAICRAVTREGGLPVMVAADEPDLLAAGLSLADGVVMPGGGDTDPALYGQPDPHPALRQVPAEQDECDAALLHAALDRDLPVLGICRGMQSLNIALGGDLVQHFDEDGVTHHNGTHAVEVCADGSAVEQMMGARRFLGRSIHHQVVDRVAQELRVTARADDGRVEAVEHVSRPVVGVQWHPELAYAGGDVQPGPFRWLVAHA